MATITVASLSSKVKDYARNQNLTDARVIRAIDTAVKFVRSSIGLPGDEKEGTITFFEDQPTYSVASDFGEPISLRFQDDALNYGKTFRYRIAEFLFGRVDATPPLDFLWGVYQATGNWTAYILGRNSRSKFVIDTFDSDDATNWVASNDAETITTDTVEKKQGSASLKFNVTTAASVNNRATLKRTFSSGTDLTSYKDIGSFLTWVYLANVTDLTSISLNWGSSDSNYYKVTVTTQQDGSAFATGWQKLKFDWNGATVTGTPVDTAIDRYWLDLDYTGAYTGGTSYRFDYLRLAIPDTLVMSYYTTNVGTASGTAIETLTATTDTFYFGTYDPGVGELIALQAAVIINPQLLVEDESVRRMYKDWTLTYSRKYPKKRANNLMANPAKAVTHHG